MLSAAREKSAQLWKIRLKWPSLRRSLNSAMKRSSCSGGARHLKSVDGAVVGLSHQLRPLPFGGLAMSAIRRQAQQMLPAIGIAQRVHLGLVHRLRHLAHVLHRVKIRNQRNRNPVQSADLVVAADHHPGLARLAQAQLGRRRRAHVVQVHRRVAGRVHGAEVAVRLLHQQRHGGMGADGHGPGTTAAEHLPAAARPTGDPNPGSACNLPVGPSRPCSFQPHPHRCSARSTRIATDDRPRNNSSLAALLSVGCSFPPRASLWVSIGCEAPFCLRARLQSLS